MKISMELKKKEGQGSETIKGELLLGYICGLNHIYYLRHL
jgi:hypothetical protein